LPPRDDQHVPVAQRHPDLRHAHAVEDERALTAQEFDGVRREGLKLGGHPRLGLDHLIGDAFLRLLDPGRDLALPDVDDAVEQAQLRTVLDGPKELTADRVDQQDARAQQDFGAQVGKPARNRRRRVDHGRDFRFHQCVRSGPIEVELVEHHDVTGAQPSQQLTGTPVDPGDADDPGKGLVVPREQTGELHATDSDKFADADAYATPKENLPLTPHPNRCR
jgi:hypothetical protein